MSEFDELLNEELKDEEFRAEYEALLPEFSAVQSAIDQRIGAAKGCFVVPDEFDGDEWNKEIGCLMTEESE